MIPAAPFVGEVTTRPPAAFSSFTAMAKALTQSIASSADASPRSVRRRYSLGARRTTDNWPGKTPSVRKPRSMHFAIASQMAVRRCSMSLASRH